ncbi:unnamed protein product [Discosporangium mesarthrocarpum]
MLLAARPSPRRRRCYWSCTSPEAKLHDMFLMAGMSESTAWRVLCKFCECFSQHMVETWIGLPFSDQELQHTMEAYHRLEFTGAVGSTDVTHLSWNKCPVVDTRSYKGKEGFPTLAYEVTVDHSMRALGATCDRPGARNKKIIVRYDETVVQVRMNIRFTDLEYTLFDADRNEYTHRGEYLIVDGGNHQVLTWGCQPLLPLHCVCIVYEECSGVCSA